MAVSSIDDRRLVESHKAGDDDAFARIVETYYLELLAHARRRLRGPQAAEDAVQESLLRAYRALDRFNGEYRLGAWLHRIVENVCADEGNRRRREAELVERITAMPPVAARDLEETARIPDPGFVRALSSLPPTYREALLLRYVDGLPYREVANLTGVTEENARARVHRAQKSLRRMLGSAPAVIWLSGAVRRAEQAITGRAGSAGSQLAFASEGPARMAGLGRVAAVVSAAALPLAGAGIGATVDWLRQAPPAQPVTAGPTTSRPIDAVTSDTAAPAPTTTLAIAASPATSAKPSFKGRVGGIVIDGDTERWGWFDEANSNGRAGAPAGEDEAASGQPLAEISGQDLPITLRGSTSRVEGAGVLLLPEGAARGTIDALLELPDESHPDRPVRVVLRFVQDGEGREPIVTQLDGIAVTTAPSESGQPRWGVEGTYRVAAGDAGAARSGSFRATFVLGDVGSIDVDLLPAT